MLTRLCKGPRRQRGDSLLEVLVTIVIVAFGLLGFAGLQSRMAVTNMESYQRGQALMLLSDMVESIRANSANAASYVSANTIGTGDGQPADCTALAVRAERDLCEWSNGLKGAAETRSAANVGAMIGARACITQVQAPNTATAVCTPGIYQVTVVWQGMNQTTAPASTCGQNLYGNDGLRRAVSARVVVSLPSCS